jgi:hypothetical protein
MELKEVLKNYRLSGFKIEFKDLYGNSYDKKDLSVKQLFKIEDLEVRDVKIYFRLKKATFVLIGLYELIKEDK